MPAAGPRFDYSEPALRRRSGAENAELREFCTGVARELERMACERAELASRLLARTQRIRARLHAA